MRHNMTAFKEQLFQLINVLFVFFYRNFSFEFYDYSTTVFVVG